MASISLDFFNRVAKVTPKTSPPENSIYNNELISGDPVALFSNQLTNPVSNNEIKSSDSVPWPKTYGPNDRYDWAADIVEGYDKGFYILGYYLSESYAPESTWLIKTDINGNILWDENLISGEYNKPAAMAQTHDGGIVLCGSDRKEGEPRSEPFVMKINACGEKEWCRKFSESPPDNLPFAYDVAVDLNGNIIVLVNEYGIHPIETMHLFKLSSDGDILWRAPYANPYNHPGSIQPLGDEIRILQNGKYLVTGDIYWKHPWEPNSSVFYQRPLFALVDSNGFEEWIIPYGLQDTLLGTAIESHPLTDTTFFAIGGDRRGSGSDIKPLMLKYDNRRNELGINSISMEQINPEYERGLFTNAILTDTAFYFGGGFFKSGLYPHMIDAKFDTDFLNPNYQAITHNIRNIRSSNYYFHTTYDDNIIIANEKRLPSQVLADIYVTKLSPDFSPCSTNLTPLTYDSLCTTPGLPQSGFISLDDCELFTDIDEIPNAKEYQEKIRWIPIKAYPNPVTEGKLTLEFENTKHHQNMELRCYDDFGRQVHSQKIYKGQQDTDVDVTGWSPGIYIAVVYSDGSARGKAKFVVR